MQGSEGSDKEEAEVISGYALGKTLGQGEHGLVKEAMHELTGEKVAIKILEKSSIGDRRLVYKVKREFQILQKLSHPNIAMLYQIIETESQYYLIMEHCSGGDLFDHIVEKERLTD